MCSQVSQDKVIAQRQVGNSSEPSSQKQRSYILPSLLKHMLETLQHPEVAGRFRELNEPSLGVQGSSVSRNLPPVTQCGMLALSASQASRSALGQMTPGLCKTSPQGFLGNLCKFQESKLWAQGLLSPVSQLTQKSKLYLIFRKRPPTIAARWMTWVGCTFWNRARVCAASLREASTSGGLVRPREIRN